MIYSVKGILTYVEPSFVVVECGGVGMKCFASTSTITQLSSVGTEVTLLTYMSVKKTQSIYTAFCLKMNLTLLSYSYP